MIIDLLLWYLQLWSIYNFFRCIKHKFCNRFFGPDTSFSWYPCCVAHFYCWLYFSFQQPIHPTV